MFQHTFYSVDIWLFFYLYIPTAGLCLSLFQVPFASYSRTTTGQQEAATVSCHQPPSTIVSAMLKGTSRVVMKGRRSFKILITLTPCIRTGTPVIFHTAVAVRCIRYLHRWAPPVLFSTVVVTEKQQFILKLLLTQHIWASFFLGRQ